MAGPAGIPTCGGITTGADATAVAGPDETTRGPEGNSESNPLPSARRFSAGLCSSIAAIHLSQKIYRVTIYYCYHLELRRSSLAIRRSHESLANDQCPAPPYPFKFIVTSLLRSRQRRHFGPFTTCFSSAEAGSGADASSLAASGKAVNPGTCLGMISLAS